MGKLLNLYAGLGGNRKLWTNVNVTAVELDERIAAVYSDNFPDDKIVVGDAMDYLKNYYKEFDFIWASPPCPTHSKMMIATRHDVKDFPDMSLYQIILFLKHFFKGRWVVENVKPYYTPLIKPTAEIGRHCFWANFDIIPIKTKNIPNFITLNDPEQFKKWLGIQYEGNIYYADNHDPSQVLRNCVPPEVGLHIMNESQREGLFNYYDL